MRLPRVRFTVRWLLVAVAVAALIPSGLTPAWRLTPASRRYQAAASLHRGQFLLALQTSNVWLTHADRLASFSAQSAATARAPACPRERPWRLAARRAHNGVLALWAKGEELYARAATRAWESRAVHHGRIAAACDRAADHPWVLSPVEPPAPPAPDPARARRAVRGW